MLNQQIGQYKIISKLGEGGMATVYLAEKGTLAKKVALKVLKDDFLSNRHIRGRFLSEARKMINLNHPNIVGVHDLIDDTDFVAIELDYIEGKTLKQHLQEKGALPDDEIEHLFKQMLDAVGYIHEKGFIHRDIKPSNFMLSENGIIKLTDFGIAKSVDDSNMDYTGTSTGMQMGTPKYMSPEQVRSTKDVDHRSDIYSLGVVLWEMVTGRVPYDIETESTFDVFEKIVREPLVLTDTKWDIIIQKATEKELVKRIKDVQEFTNQKNHDSDGDKTVVPDKKEEKVNKKKTVVSVEKEENNKSNLNLKANKDLTRRKINNVLFFIMSCASIIAISILAWEHNYPTGGVEGGWVNVSFLITAGILTYFFIISLKRSNDIKILYINLKNHKYKFIIHSVVLIVTGLSLYYYIVPPIFRTTN